MSSQQPDKGENKIFKKIKVAIRRSQHSQHSQFLNFLNDFRIYNVLDDLKN
jgi:hypothetical protein